MRKDIIRRIAPHDNRDRAARPVIKQVISADVKVELIMNEPVVFLSYSHDTDAHKEWVLRLAIDLRTKGVDAHLDQWDLSPGQDIAAFMQQGVLNADRVLMICSEDYVNKSEQGSGGVGYERLIITAEILQTIDTKKFIPLVRNNNSANKVPRFLGPRLYVDFSKEEEYNAKLEDLLRNILNTPSAIKPPLGKNPFSGTTPTPTIPVRTTSSTGTTLTGIPILDDQWFQKQAAHATQGITKQESHTHMEIRFALHDPTRKSQIELLNAVQKSEIKTFGWPIGVTLENRDEFKPRPYEDGVRAEIAINRDYAIKYMENESYDYWALKSNGDFYCLQSLFEDVRAKDQIFFNTRIVRVTEALLFARNLYANLGAAPEARISVRIAHRGFAGRTLTSSSINRRLYGSPKAAENESQAEIVVTLDAIRSTLVEDVERLTAPFFMLFDFKEIGERVYEDIVRRFEKGEAT